MRCKVLKYTNHSVEFMAKRGIEEREVEDVVRNGEVVEEYLNDKPFASRLMFALVNGRPLHLVVGFDDVEEICFVITAYEPNTDKFEADFKTRKRK